MNFDVPFLPVYSTLFPLTMVVGGSVCDGENVFLDGVTFCTGRLGLVSSNICLGLLRTAFNGVGSDLEVASVLWEGDA